MPRGTVNYHCHRNERQAYHIDADGMTGRLTSPEQIATEVELYDVREHPTSFADDGIAFVGVSAPPAMNVDGWEARYEAELQALLTQELGASDVRVFDHTVRIDDPTAPRRPARNVHTDYSSEGARARLDMLVGAEEASLWEAGHYAFVNVWRPVSEVVRSAPLGFVRPRTVAPADWVVLDLIYPDRVGQILGLVGNPAHQWLYQSAMTSREAVMFNIFDNQGRPPVAHSAIDLVGSDPHAVRKSLESRTLIRHPTH